MMFKWFKKRVPAGEDAGPLPMSEVLNKASCKQQGNELLAQGMLEEAAACYRQALALDAGYADAHLNLGFVLKEQGRNEQALAHLQQAVLLDPGMGDGFYLLGSMAREQGNLAAAAAHLHQALAVKPDFETV